MSSHPVDTCTSSARSGRVRGAIAGASAPLVLLLLLPAGAQGAIPFKEVRMIIEYNSSAEDVGIQFFLDSEGWKSLSIYAPGGDKIYSTAAAGRLLAQGGGTELFVESVEPELTELPLGKFFQRFPAGRYKFLGVQPDGVVLRSFAPFTHVIPEGPEIVEPQAPPDKCANNVGIPAVIAWEPVTETIFGAPVEIVGYEVIVENGEVFDVHLPGDATQITVPAEFLEPGTDYIFEVLAIAKGGNQTITEGCFTTGN